MNTTTETRAIRCLLASLLNSDLSPTELSEIGDALIHDRSFITKLAGAVKDVSGGFEPEHVKRFHKPRAGNELLVEELVVALKTAGIPKGQLLNEVTMRLPETPISSRSTIREIVSKLVQGLPKSVLYDFLSDQLHSSGMADSYLQGILKRHVY